MFLWVFFGKLDLFFKDTTRLNFNSNVDWLKKLGREMPGLVF
jgi:hypothetical protein